MPKKVCELPVELTKYPDKYISIFVPKKDIKVTLIDNPVPSNKDRPKRLDDFFRELLKERRLEMDIDELHAFFISRWKFRIRLEYAYYSNKLRLNLCLLYAYTNLNLKYDFMDTYSRILCYLIYDVSFSIFFFNENFVHISKQCIAVTKKTVSSNCIFILLIAQFLVKVTDRLDSKFDQELIELHAFFISNTFISNTRLKLAKKQAKATQHPEAELLLFENFLLSSSTLLSKDNSRF